MRLHVVVRGRVQGVGFRWFVRETAERIAIAGWVRNRADGTVEVAAEGEADVLARFRAVLAEGPRGASVESVDDVDDDSASDPLERPFKIAR